MLIRTLLISLILLCGVAAGSIQTADFVSFVWKDGGAVDEDNGGGAKKSVWEANSPSDFFVTATGEAISDATTHNGTDDACDALEGAGDTVKVLAPNVDDFAAVIAGTIANLSFKVKTGLNGRYFVTRIDDDEVTIEGLTFSGDMSGGVDDCDIWVGGITGSLVNLINATADLVDATSVNCDVFIKGDETLTADFTLSAGGGSASTMLHLLGVDTSWVRIVPTRTAISGGKSNGPLDTSIMPKITLNTGVEFVTNVPYLQLDGFWFSGDSPTIMVGQSAADYQIVTNCVFQNSNTGASATLFRTDNNARIDNCDFIGTGASGGLWLLSVDDYCDVVNCRFTDTSNSTTRLALQIRKGAVVNCIFHNLSGIGIAWPLNPFIASVIGCTFESVNICVQTANNDDLYVFTISNTIASNCTTFFDNQHVSDALLLAQFNHLFNVTNSYDKAVGQIGFQDLTSDPLFVNAGTNDYNLQAGSPAKNSGSFGNNRGAMSDVEAGGGGGQPVLGGSIVR